jgi:hypothetical protein
MKTFDGPDGLIYVWGRVVALGAPRVESWTCHQPDRAVRTLVVEGFGFDIWDTPENRKMAGLPE